MFEASGLKCELFVEYFHEDMRGNWKIEVWNEKCAR